MEEVWKDIKGYVNLYQVSDFGRVKSLGHYTLMKNGKTRYHKGKIIIHNHYTNGYCFVCLSKNGIHKQFLLHRLVLITFIGEKPGYEVNHIDENKDNNRLDNLEWVTHRYNCQYGTRNARCKEHSDFRGEKNPMYGRKGALNPRSKKCYAEKDGIALIFDSIKSLADFLGYEQTYVGEVAKHARKTTEIKGYKLYTEDNFKY